MFKEIKLLGNKWLHIHLNNNVWLELEIVEEYKVAEKYRHILGYTDVRTMFNFGFRIPFRKEVNTLEFNIDNK